MIKNKYVIYLYTMNTNTNMNYINMIQTTLSNLYNYMYSVANDDTKNQIVKFHELPIPMLLFAIVKFNKETMNIEIDKMMSSYKIDDQFKPEILKYIELLIELSDEIKKTI